MTATPELHAVSERYEDWTKRVYLVDPIEGPGTKVVIEFTNGSEKHAMWFLAETVMQGENARQRGLV